MIELTRDLAWAASCDEGDRHMRAAGRKSWDESDFNAAAEKFNELWPDPLAAQWEKENKTP